MVMSKVIPLAVVLFFGAPGLALAQEEKPPAPQEPKDDARLKQMVDDLGSDVFEVREKATQALREAKEEAVSLLRRAVAYSPKYAPVLYDLAHYLVLVKHPAQEVVR